MAKKNTLEQAYLTGRKMIVLATTMADLLAQHVKEKGENISLSNPVALDCCKSTSVAYLAPNGDAVMLNGETYPIKEMHLLDLIYLCEEVYNENKKP